MYPINVEHVGHKNLNVEKVLDGSYKYQYAKKDEVSECYLKYNYVVKKDGPVYVTMDFDNMDGFKVMKDNNTLNNFSAQKYTTITASGNHKAGEMITFYAYIEEEKSGTGKMFAYQMNEELFREGIAKLSKGGLDVSSYSDTEINGTFTAENDGVFYTSIPYDGGWKAYVDGKETEITPLKNAFVCVPVTAGTHEITLKYCPPGFVAGGIMTIASVLIFAAIWVLEKKYNMIEKLSEKVNSKPLKVKSENSSDSASADENVNENRKSSDVNISENKNEKNKNE